MAKTCPVCGLLNPPEGLRCDCGWDFTAKRVEHSYINPNDKENRAELGMTIGRVGRRNLWRGAVSLAGGIGLAIFVFATDAARPAGMENVVGKGAFLVNGLVGAGGLAATGLGLLYRGWCQRRASQP